MGVFKELSYQSQIRVLRRVATNTLKQYPLKVRSIDFIQHGENTTYKITDTKSNKYLLRIHRQGYHSKKGIEEELKWLDRLGRTTEIVAPVPLKTNSDSFIATESLGFENEERNLTLLKWVEGRQIKKSFSDNSIKEIGKLTADLHSNTKNIKVLHRNYWSAEGLVGKKPFMGPIDAIVGLNSNQQQTLNEARTIVFDRLSKYERKYKNKTGLIHADLHFGNFFLKDGKISPIDFDDCGYGFHMYDLAVTMTSLENSIVKKIITKKEFDHTKDVLLNSYNSFYPLTEDDLKIIDDLKLARRFLGTQWLNLRADNPNLKKRSVPYARETVKILKKSLGI